MVQEVTSEMAQLLLRLLGPFVRRERIRWIDDERVVGSASMDEFHGPTERRMAGFHQCRPVLIDYARLSCRRLFRQPMGP